MKTRIITHAFIFFILAISFSCEKPERNNPWDEKADPTSWTPQNLQIEDVSITEKKLTWTYDGDDRFEGFKLDRKKGDEAWQEAYQTFAKETRNWNDTEVIPDPDLTYSYRIYAYAGKSSSSRQSVSSSGEIAAPTNLQTEKLTEKSYKLTWTDNSTGEQGFKVDRKIEEGEWIKAYKTVAENQNSFTDTNVFRATNIEYRVYAFFESYESSKTTINTNTELTAPTDLQFTNNSISSVTLIWQDNSTGEDGFKIERKYEGGDWTQLTTLTTNNYEDNDFDLNTQVYYRVCSYVGTYNSSWAENDFDATIPPPENFDITANSATSVTLIWDYNQTGHDGFKIDRKINEGTWEAEFETLNAGQTSCSDNGLDLTNNIYSYRIYSFYQTYQSPKLEYNFFACGFSKLIDRRDGNEYETVQIGNQCWMKENLAYLPGVSPSSNGSNTESYYYVYGYQGTNVSQAIATSNYQTYGVLYNWPAAVSACPQGWSLPSDDEWTVLTDYLGGNTVAGGKMKETGTTHWNSPNTGATNSSGFSGLPGGYRTTSGNFGSIGGSGVFWGSTEGSTTDAWYRYLYYNDDDANSYNDTKGIGFSVRCLRDL